MCRFDTPVSVYSCYMNSLQPTMWPGILVYIHFTLLAYAPEQICLLHCIYIPAHYYHNLHTDPTLQHISKKQQNETIINHVITTYVPTTNMPLKCYTHATYENYFMCKYKTTMPIYMPHMNSLQSTIWPGTLVYMYFTFLQAPYQMCLPHCTYEMCTFSHSSDLSPLCRSPKVDQPAHI